MPSVSEMGLAHAPPLSRGAINGLAREMISSLTMRGDSVLLRGVRDIDIDRADLTLQSWRDRPALVSQINRLSSADRRQKLLERREKQKTRLDEDDENIVKYLHDIEVALINRVQCGDSFEGGIVNDRLAPAYGLKRGKRSALAAILTYAVRSTHRGRYWSRRYGTNTIMAGDNKAYVDAFEQKFNALDCAYFVTNAEMRGSYNVDIDGVFPSIVNLVDQILATGCPAPNTISYHVGRDGSVRTPHLHYYLAHPVCFTDAGRSAPQDLYKQIARVLYERLAPIGADPNASNGTRTKNPLSRIWHTTIAYGTPYSLGTSAEGFPSLADLLNVRQYGRRRSVIGFLTDLQLELELGGSNSLFVVTGHVARRLVHFYHPASRRRPFVLAEHRELSDDDSFDLFTAAIRKMLAPYFEDRVRLEQQIQKTAEYYWEGFDPTRASDNRRRGAMAGEPEYAAARSKREKQQAGGRFAAALRRDHTLIRIAEAAERIGVPAEDIPVVELARASGVSRQTLWRNRDRHEEGRELLAEYRLSEAALLENPLGTAENRSDSDGNIQCLDKRVLGASLPDQEGAHLADDPEKGLVVEPAGPARVKDRTPMGSAVEKYKIHPKNPVFLISIAAGHENDSVKLIPLDPEIPPPVFDAVTADAIRHIDDWGREFMGSDPVISGLDGSILWRCPDTSDDEAEIVDVIRKMRPPMVQNHIFGQSQSNFAASTTHHNDAALDDEKSIFDDLVLAA